MAFSSVRTRDAPPERAFDAEAVGSLWEEEV
jgi:hypothetical protein